MNLSAEIIFRSSRNRAPEVAQRVEQDRNDAISMTVTATPEYFVNSRPLPSFGDQQLLNLVREKLQKAY